MMKNNLLAFWQDEEGATAIEYGLIAGLISIAILAFLPGIGENLGIIFERIRDGLVLPTA